MDGDDLSDAVEVGLLGLGSLELDVHVLANDVVRLEVGVGPLAEGGEESSVLLLHGGVVARVVHGGEVTDGAANDGGPVSREEGP